MAHRARRKDGNCASSGPLIFPATLTASSKADTALHLNSWRWKDDMEEWEDDDVQPFADPNIRADYEVALGRLILAHNEVDYRLAKALVRVVNRLAPDDSLKGFAQGKFYERLSNLELFQKAVPNSGVVGVDIGRLRELNTIRNHVAHGHFEQNPFSGAFLLVSGQKTPRNYTASELEAAANELRSIAGTLYAHEAFGDPGYPMAPSAPPNLK
jgi:hypothetical protein